ncbi:hypothetical protein AMJ85_11830 [candidate division BRC1 bacterium SM23_51]|nr:MAG: hypothetical protein AMJ85_11830 [candidate division BRC1 bacterium SM23_51]
MSGFADLGQADSQTAAAEAAKPSDFECLFPQTRALEIHLPTGFESADAAQLVSRVRSAGFNTIVLSCFRHGYTLYPSPTMRAYRFPRQDPRFRGSDPVLAVLSAARGEGLTVYALLDSLRVGGEKRRRSPILRRHSDWGVRGRNRSRARRTAGASLATCPMKSWRAMVSGESIRATCISRSSRPTSVRTIAGVTIAARPCGIRWV